VSDQRAKGFLQHIAADPDDAPRLIYADWLEEHGDEERAEFIRVQIERASLPKWDARQVRLRLRERELLTQHGRKWKAKLPRLKGITWGDLRRGFVATVTFDSFEVLRQKAGACCRAAPVEAITVRWPRQGEASERISPIAGLRELVISGQVVDRREVGLLADAPLLSTLRVLTIPRANLGVEGFHRLTASPHLGNLRALRLPGNAIGNRCVRALFDAASLGSLEELDLSGADSYSRYNDDPIIESTGVEAMVGWPGMSRIRSLNLSGGLVGQRGLRALLRSPRTTGLKELVLCDNGLLGQALQEFESARPELQLDVLDLGHNSLRDLGAAYLAKADCLRELKVLGLEACDLEVSAARRLAGAPFLATLRRLNVGYNSFRSAGLEAILESTHPQLHTLLLGFNDVGDEGVEALAKSPGSDALLELDLGSSNLGDAAVQALARSKHLRKLLILRLKPHPIAPNRIFKKSADALRASPLGKRLAILEMTKGVTDKDNPS
jgi:uncharacterized protein (TIGR02996 family)